MQLANLIRASGPPEPWAEGDNIPWNEPEFSARMLREHLSAEHDMASRRGATIDRQVAWIGSHLLGGQATRILDLACGPGLYGQRLAAGGHEYVGIDYSPASIAHAQRENAAGTGCTYIEQDVRQADFGSGFGLVMMLYGELNVFCPVGRAGDSREGARGASAGRFVACWSRIRVMPSWRSAASSGPGRRLKRGFSPIGRICICTRGIGTSSARPRRGGSL